MTRPDAQRDWRTVLNADSEWDHLDESVPSLVDVDPDRRARRVIGATVGVFASLLVDDQPGGHDVTVDHLEAAEFEDHRARADKYSTLTAQKMHQAGKKASGLKPYLSALGRFVSMYLFKAGFLDGKMGFKIAQISAQSNVFKYKELRRLNREND